jgi:hypothetical protein
LSLSSPFLHMFLLHPIFILIKYSLFCHGNGANWAHRLSLAARSYHFLAITERQ